MLWESGKYSQFTGEMLPGSTVKSTGGKREGDPGNRKSSRCKVKDNVKAWCA